MAALGTRGACLVERLDVRAPVGLPLWAEHQRPGAHGTFELNAPPTVQSVTVDTLQGRAVPELHVPSTLQPERLIGSTPACNSAEATVVRDSFEATSLSTFVSSDGTFSPPHQRRYGDVQDESAQSSSTGDSCLAELERERHRSARLCTQLAAAESSCLQLRQQLQQRQEEHEWLQKLNAQLHQALQTCQADLAGHQNMLRRSVRESSSQTIAAEYQLHATAEQSTALKEQMALMKTQLEALQRILAIQDETLATKRIPSTGDAQGTSPSEELLLTRWRKQVFELLLVQRKSQLAAKQRDQQHQDAVTQLRAEATALARALQVSEQRTAALKAELDAERINHRLSTTALDERDGMRKQLRQLQANWVTQQAACKNALSLFSDWVAGLEAPMNAAVTRMSEFTQRLQFGKGRVLAARDLILMKRGRSLRNASTPRVQDKMQIVALGFHYTKAESADTPGSAAYVPQASASVWEQEARQLADERAALVRRLQALTDTSQLQQQKRHIESLEQQLREQATATEAAEAETQRLQEELKKSEKALAHTISELQQLQRHSTATAEAARRSEAAAVRATELSFKQQMQEQQQEHSKVVELLRRELDNTTRENARVLLAIQRMESAANKDQLRRTEAEQAKYRLVENKIATLEKQLLALRRERSTLMAAVRQAESRTQQSTPANASTHDHKASPNAKVRHAGTQVAFTGKQTANKSVMTEALRTAMPSSAPFGRTQTHPARGVVADYASAPDDGFHATDRVELMEEQANRHLRHQLADVDILDGMQPNVSVAGTSDEVLEQLQYLASLSADLLQEV
eukprot:jgi/Chlat1/3464/Chrsp23S03783